MTIKVQILTPCEACDGDAYLPVGEAVSNTGEKYMRYEPCKQCEGSGNRARWISLRDFAEMLEAVMSTDPMEPDLLALSQEKFVSQYQESREAAGA